MYTPQPRWYSQKRKLGHDEKVSHDQIQAVNGLDTPLEVCRL